MAEWDVPGFTELRQLGSGGFGDVVLARHDESGTLVAIKYLRQNLLSDPEFTQMFRAEAAVLGTVDDPHVVRLYEYVESPQGAAIVMELVDGVSLREILVHEGATTPEAALVVLKGSLLGLAAAHQHGVVHRDYKPENVLVDGDGASKLTDFGIAARAGDSTPPAGTLVYAPPEQFGNGPASPAGDVYAATATFYECLAGRPPFIGNTAERLLYQHMAEPVPLELVPETLRPLVTAGMAKNPRDRPADGTRFVTELDAVAAGTYGPDWEQRGRSHLGETALLLAALWPSGAAPALQGSAVDKLNLSEGNAQTSSAGAQTPTVMSPNGETQHLWHVKHLKHLAHERHLTGLRLAAVGIMALAIVGGGAAAAVALTSTHKASAPPPQPAAAVHLVTLQPSPPEAAGSASASPKQKKEKKPSVSPSSFTTIEPVAATTSASPSKKPSKKPSPKPSAKPSPKPSPSPSASPTVSVTATPTPTGTFPSSPSAPPTSSSPPPGRGQGTTG
jgi:serine/threonine protein kinase